MGWAAPALRGIQHRGKEEIAVKGIAIPAFGSVFVERLSDGEFIPIALDGAVKPNEGIRITADFKSLGSTYPFLPVPLFMIFDVTPGGLHTGDLVYSKSTGIGLLNNKAQIYVGAPLIEGRYLVVVQIEQLGDLRQGQTWFRVNSGAPPPPKAAPPGKRPGELPFHIPNPFDALGKLGTGLAIGGVVLGVAWILASRKKK